MILFIYSSGPVKIGITISEKKARGKNKRASSSDPDALPNWRLSVLRQIP
jgi:hypothetical protein